MATEKKEVTTIEEDMRSFFGPDETTKYYIKAPTAEDIRGADWQYSKIYTLSLVEGITTTAEMMDILMRRGIVGPEFEQRAQELARELNSRILRLEQEEDMEIKRELSVEVAISREELFQWNQRLNGPMSNTCEQIADDARLEFITSCIIINQEGNNVWNSFEEYKKEKNQALAMRARFETMLYLQGLDSDFLDNTPEARAMREVEIEVMDKAREALEAAQAIAEEEMVEKEKETPKKRTRKKTTTKKTTNKNK